jgi:hypothetical protein
MRDACTFTDFVVMISREVDVVGTKFLMVLIKRRAEVTPTDVIPERHPGDYVSTVAEN